MKKDMTKDNPESEKSLLMESANKNIFFQDFLTFLKLVEQRSFDLTPTNNLQLKEIEELGKLFKHDIYHRDTKGNIMFKIRKENEVKHLLWIRQVAFAMFLVYKRKGKLFLTKNGKGYLHNIGPDMQFQEMVLWYLDRCNWGYMHPYSGYDSPMIAEVLQQYQKSIWRYLIDKNNWINFSLFAKGLTDFYKLSYKDIYRKEQPDNVAWVIESVLIDDLKQLGLIENKKDFDKYGISRTIIFRPTPTGICIFKKYLNR